MKQTSRLVPLIGGIFIASGLLALTTQVSFGKEEKDAPKTSSIKIDHKIAATDLPALAKISFF